MSDGAGLSPAERARVAAGCPHDSAPEVVARTIEGRRRAWFECVECRRTFDPRSSGDQAP